MHLAPTKKTDPSGNAGIQSGTERAPTAAHAAPVPDHSATPTRKALITYAEAGKIMGLGERKAREIVDKLVTPVVLGPRCVRIVRAELEAALVNLPRRVKAIEPAHLLRGKVERLKHGGSPAQVGA
jgi:hypothetical protein